MSLITISCLILVVFVAFADSFLTPGQPPGWAALILSDVSNGKMRSSKTCKVRSRLECLIVCHRVPDSYVITWLPSSDESTENNCFCQNFLGTIEVKANMGARIYQMEYGELCFHIPSIHFSNSIRICHHALPPLRAQPVWRSGRA